MIGGRPLAGPTTVEFTRELIDNVLARTSLPAVVGRKVRLAKKGRSLVGLCPLHSERTPSFHVYDDGHYKCFGCGRHGDAIQFLADAEGIGFEEAVLRLAREAGLPLPDHPGGLSAAYSAAAAAPNCSGLPRTSPSQPDEWAPIAPPADAAPPSARDLRCDVLYTYRDAGGRVLLYVRRFESRGRKGKNFLPLSFGKLNGRLGWHPRAPAAPRPLYGLDRIAARPGADVVACEGEKAADAAQRLLPDSVCVCWFGGCGQLAYADLRPLERRRVIIWPDADEPGRRAAAEIQVRLPHARILRVDDLPDGSDAADVTPDDPAAWLQSRLQSQRAPAHSFRVLTPVDCDSMAPPPYVVKGLICGGDHILMIGQPGAGKSVFAPYVAYAVAQGRLVLGRRVKSGPVLYLASEDGAGMMQRVRALRRRWGEAPNFHLVPDALDLLRRDGPHRGELHTLVSELRPVLIVIDTVVKAFPGLRENEPDDTGMGAVVAEARDLAGITGSAVVSLLHPPKDGGGGTARGHSCLNGDADVTMIVEGSGRAPRTVCLGKNRHGPSDAVFHFTVEAENLGTDEDGDVISAPIACETKLTATDKEARLPDRPAVLLRLLRDEVAEHGAPSVPEPGMPAVICVTRGMLRKRLIAQSWFSEDLLQNAPSGRVELARAGYGPENHALTALKRKGFLGFNRKVVWLP